MVSDENIFTMIPGDTMATKMEAIDDQYNGKTYVNTSKK